MPERSSTKRAPRNADEPGINRIAFNVVEQATGEADSEQHPELTADGKNAAAVALGRRGGLKGGSARAAKLSAEERSNIARNAAQVRWRKNEDY